MDLNVLQNLKTNNIHYDPYPHIYIENVYPTKTFDTLYENFPVSAIKDNTQAIQSHTHRYLADDVLNKDVCNTPNIWKDFFELHTSQKFYEQVLNIFNTHFKKYIGENVRVRGTEGNTKIVTDTQFVVHRPYESTTRTTHLDNPLELYAGLLYFRQRDDKTKGGNFEIFKTDEIKQVYANTGREVPENVEKTLTKTIPYKANSFVLFVNTNKSVHGVTPRAKTLFDRLSVNIIAEIERRKDAPLFTLEEIRK